MLLSHTQILDLHSGGYIEPHFLQHFARSFDGLVPVNHKAVFDLVTDEYVFIYRHFGDKRQFLINNGYAGLFAVANAAKLLRFSAENNISGIFTVRINSTQYFHQGGFTCAVFPDKTMNLTLGDSEIDVVQSFHAREFLGNGFHL